MNILSGYISIIIVFLFFILFIPLMIVIIFLAFKCMYLTIYFAVCASFHAVSCVLQMEVKTTNLQSIFQLGAALCLALTAAGPQIRELLTNHFNELNVIRESAAGLKDQVGAQASRHMEMRVKILDFLERIIEKEINDIKSSNPHQLFYYTCLSIFNIIFLLIVTFWERNISAALSVPFLLVALLPPVLVPLQIFPRLFLLARYIKQVLDSVRYIPYSGDDEEQLKRILHQVAQRAISQARPS
ncbi:hypothetical protein GE253_23860 [Niveispirillum sp. SYP-B3756]|uniref:hypothetical protein n=1 Tax=Niveispirillum sp. SYP-B3756 TaxID=2662178 RepID=UPI001291313A|nr:hypothetical protein [Niveispirillum sp. SYP-B3756]MQP68360.1 hypothetical protein [Niveispirillum sp. SYP-B3756]